MKILYLQKLTIINRNLVRIRKNSHYICYVIKQQTTDMNRLENIYELMGLFSAIPVGTEEKIVINNTTITLSKTTDAVNVQVKFTKDDKCPCGNECVCHEEFDDTNIRWKVEMFKKNVNDIDHEVFLECLEELKEEIDLKEFSDLLDLEHYNEEEAERVDDLIDISTLVIHEVIQNWMQDIVDDYEELAEMIEKFK